MKSTTICGSDLHYYRHFQNGAIRLKEPLCPDHESAGRILSTGSKVSEVRPGLKPGTRVALEVGFPFGECDIPGARFSHCQGTLQRCVNHPAKWVHEFPPEIDFEVRGALGACSGGSPGCADGQSRFRGLQSGGPAWYLELVQWGSSTH